MLGALGCLHSPGTVPTDSTHLLQMIIHILFAIKECCQEDRGAFWLLRSSAREERAACGSGEQQAGFAGGNGYSGGGVPARWKSAETSGRAARVRAAPPALPEPRPCGQGKGVGQRHPAAAAPALPAWACRAGTVPLNWCEIQPRVPRQAGVRCDSGDGTAGK